MSYAVLVVDDNDMNLMLISKILELENYQVVLARNGREAIQSVVAKMPDLAILDVMMPDMDGYELCQKLRQPQCYCTDHLVDSDELIHGKVSGIEGGSE